MEAFEGAVKADELTLVVIKTLHLDRIVECRLLYWGGFMSMFGWEKWAKDQEKSLR